MAIFDNKDKIFELMDKFDKSMMTEFEISAGEEFCLKMSKSKGTINLPESKNIPVSTEIKTERTDEISVAPKPSNAAKTITAPLVGTFYSAPSPDSEPFVKVGDKITKGMVLCIIEAMKTMNEIESDTDGVIAEILVESGKPVEYGQELFIINN